jgi:hypothetical protein
MLFGCLLFALGLTLLINTKNKTIQS